MITLGKVQVDKNLPCRTSLDLLWRDLDDFISFKISVTKASHSHWRCQATQGERRDLASGQLCYTNRVVVGVGNVQFVRRKAQAAGFIKLRLLAIAAPGLAAAQISSRCRCGWANFLDFVVVRISYIEDVVVIGHPKGMLQPYLLLANAILVAELKKPFTNDGL